MISSLISVVVVRVVLCYVISDAFGQQYMFACYAGAWLVGVILSGGYFLLGRWKRFGSMAAAENRMREKRTMRGGNRLPAAGGFFCQEKMIRFCNERGPDGI